MIFDELVVDNYGPYKGRQALALAPISADQRIVLIGALNGSGKTTLLEATQIALYGRLAHGSGRWRGGYERFLRDSIHAGANPKDGAAVELSFKTFRAGQAEQLRVVRSWSERKSGSLRESVAVHRNGEVDAALSEAWTDQVEAFAPGAVAGLFFFDGERVEELADIENAQAALRATLGSLIGLDLLEQLANDVRVLERRHTALTVDDRTAKDALEHASADADVAAARVQEQELACQVIRDNLAAARSRLNAIETRFRQEGGDLYEERTRLEENLREAKTRVALSESALRELAAGIAPLLLLEPQVAQLSERATKMVEAQQAAVLGNLLKKRDAAVVRRLRKLTTDKTLVTAVAEDLASDRAQRAAVVEAVEIAPRVLESAATAGELSQHTLPELRRNMRKLLRKAASAYASLDEAERLVAAVPSAERLDTLLNDRSYARSEVERLELQAAAGEDDLAGAKRERDRLIDSRDRMYRRHAESLLARKDAERLLHHAARVRGTLAALATRATSQHISRIEKHVNETIRHLLRKEHLISRVELDPKSVTMRLLGSDGQELSARKLSAGERQLVALGTLWGLARASGRPLPVMIDTPLGRLDESHRRLVVERYLPAASHQVVVLSTDTEVDQAAYDLLRPYVGRTYTIEHDDPTGSSKVRDGYFDVVDALAESEAA